MGFTNHSKRNLSCKSILGGRFVVNRCFSVFFLSLCGFSLVFLSFGTESIFDVFEWKVNKKLCINIEF